MEQRKEHRTRKPSGADRWRRVVGWSPLRHPLYTGVIWAMGAVAYRFMPRGTRSDLVAYDVVAEGRLSRSGQPSSAGWRYLRVQGVRTVVSLRLTDDNAQRLRKMGFHGYLHLPIPDGLPPTDGQAAAFLRYVVEPSHWPVHLHCLTGVQRSGTMVALVRYAVEGWSMEEALREARAYFPGPTALQVRWLKRWAAGHSRGEYRWDEEG